MESFELQNKYINLSLLTNISNIEDLKSILNNQISEKAFLKPDLIIDVFQVNVVLVACLTNFKNDRLITKNISSEVILLLSATKNISKSLKLFNWEGGDKLLLVTIGEENTKEDLIKILETNSIKILPLSELKSNDEEKIKKVYKISDKELRASSLLDSVVSRIAANMI